jgi:hypothetical protein
VCGSRDLALVLLRPVAKVENVLLTEFGVVVKKEFGVQTEI